MLDKKELKKQGLKILKNNIWTLILVGIVMTFILGTSTINQNGFDNLNITYRTLKEIEKEQNETGRSLSKERKTEILKKYGNNIFSQILYGSNSLNIIIKQFNEENNIKKGVFYSIFTILVRNEEQVQKAVKDFIEDDNPEYDRYFIVIVASIALLIKIFITNPVIIGERRIYLESINYKKTKLNVLSSPFQKSRYLNCVKIILIRNFFQLLWNLTLVGGFVKNYSYKMIPFIAAENSKISAKDCMKISKEMMNGYKLELFKLDCTFILWDILVILTFGLAGIFVAPYYRATYTELYSELRKKYITNKMYKYELLNDDALFSNPNNLQVYKKTEKTRKIKLIKEDLEQISLGYDFFDYILFFFIFSFIGWIWEVFYFTFESGLIINRGVLYGPWLPIYGLGCSLTIFLFSRSKYLRKLQYNPLKTFLFVVILCTTLEYFTSIALENIFSQKYWDYTGIFFNIKGRVCLENSIFFGIGGSLCIYIFGPFLQKNIHKFMKREKFIFCMVFIVLMIGDICYTLINPHSGDYITFTPATSITQNEERKKVEDNF